MKLLFIHQNFPGQYLNLAKHLGNTGKHTIYGLGETVNIQKRGTLPCVATIGYPTPEGAGATTHHYLKSTEAATRRGQAVLRLLLRLRQQGFLPDVICVHPGWGEALFIRHAFPTTPILLFCEFFFRAKEANLNFDPEFPDSEDWSVSIGVRNTPQVLPLLEANACISPTRWQASRYPKIFQSKMHRIHEGVDTVYMRPAEASEAPFVTLTPLQTAGESRVTAIAGHTYPLGEAASGRGPLTLRPENKVVTFVARNLEPYRGFHTFMRLLPDLLERHPDAHIVIVGGDGVSYSPKLPNGESYKARCLAAAPHLNLNRVHFLGKIPYAALRALFHITTAHVYLTYPFVLSWSVLEAMACESLVIASRTEPVMEVMRHNENGLLVDFFNKDNELLNTLDTVLSSPEDFTPLRKNARTTIVERYELQNCLRLQTHLLEGLAKGNFPL